MFWLYIFDIFLIAIRTIYDKPCITCSNNFLTKKYNQNFFLNHIIYKLQI